MCLAVLLPVHAEPLPKQEIGNRRPKICLVLGGGGARGAAHIGVLKVLEEYRVPVDCIAGTSMGALVGAAYASGMSTVEMDKIITGISTELLFQEKPQRHELNIRDKQDDYKIFFGPQLGLKDGKIKLPKGVVTGVQLETVLRGLSKVKGYYNFDKLPIPFRAVATDLLTGRKVVLSDGELANVMRASMSVPGAVAPAEMNGMMLVDGMLTSNLPVETAREMGADIVIAVNVGTPLLKKDEINGILGVTGQMVGILAQQNVEVSLAQLRPNDILITPDLGSFSTTDFDHLPKISPLGEGGARKVAKRLMQLSLPADDYAAHRRRQKFIVVTDERPVDEIRFEKLQRVNDESAKSVMQTKVGQPIEQKTLDSDMLRLYGTGNFEHVNYRFLEEPGKRVLAVDAVEKTWGPDYLRFGFGLSSDFKGDAFFNFLISYRKTWMNSLGAEWRSDVQIGRTNSLQTEFYQPLNDKGTFFVAPHAGIERRTADLYQRDNRIATYDLQSAMAGADTGMNFGRYGELRLGVLGGVLKPELDTGPESLSPGEPHIKQGAFRAQLVLDQMNSVVFPRKGWRGSLRVFDSNSSLGTDDPYTKWDGDFAAAYSIGEHTFNLGLKAGGKIGSKPLPRYDQFQWGGFLQQSGYATGQLIGENLRFGRIMYYRRILRSSFLEGAYGGLSVEVGKVGNPLVPGNSDDVLKSVGIFIATDSPAGPAYLGFGHSADGNNSIYFYLGRPF